MKTKNCAYCGYNMTSYHRQLMTESLVVKSKVVTLCPECGEPLVVEAGGYRKPTADEHVEFHDDKRIEIARHAWLDIKQVMKTHKTTPLGEFFQRVVTPIMEDLKDVGSEEENRFIKQVVLHTFALTANEVILFMAEALKTSASLEQFEGRLLLLESEIDAFMESMSEQFEKEHTGNGKHE